MVLQKGPLLRLKKAKLRKMSWIKRSIEEGYHSRSPLPDHRNYGVLNKEVSIGCPRKQAPKITNQQVNYTSLQRKEKEKNPSLTGKDE